MATPPVTNAQELPRLLRADPRVHLEEPLELPGAAALRVRVLERRSQGTAVLAEQTPGARAAHPAPTSLDALVARLEAHRGLLWFDLRAPASGWSRLFTPFKLLQRRVLRSYLVQQDAFNSYALDFLRALAAEQRRPSACGCDLEPDSLGPEARAPERQALLLRASGRQATTGPVAISASLVSLFAGCRLVLGAGRGIAEALVRLRDHGVPALALTSCPGCQRAARRAGLRVAEGEVTAYFTGDNSFGADGVVLSHVVERLTPADTVGLLRRLRAGLPPGAPLAIVGASTRMHVDQALGRAALPEDLRLYPVEFLSKLAAASGFEVLGVSFV